MVVIIDKRKNRMQDCKYAPVAPYKPVIPERKNFIVYQNKDCIYTDFDLIDEGFDIEEYFEEQEIRLVKPEKSIREISLQDIVSMYCLALMLLY